MFANLFGFDLFGVGHGGGESIKYYCGDPGSERKMSNHDFSLKDISEETMGIMSSYRWKHDPKTVLFMLARYKFVSKMLEGYRHVLEIGCGDAFGSRLVAESVDYLDCIDIDRQMIDSASFHPKISYECTNKIKPADAIYALDVIEHMQYTDSVDWIAEIAKNTNVCIIGSPSLESQAYASPLSKENHINCLSSPELKSLMKNNFKHVFMFSMNDETLHTGFHKMAHYIFAMGVK